ncbi:hypothetical protein L218DRAFT_734607 [Marasmius fiardii PR-910]|nr:hypothetical protein L218DRAFT_734607 [Marasmius fiardii PR-910]
MASRKVVESGGEGIGLVAGTVASDNGVTAVILVVSGFFLSGLALYRYLRFFIYPCLTPFELDQALKNLDDVYSTTRSGEADAPEWIVIANDYLNLKIEASRIRQKSLQGSTWKTYFGFHPRLILDIVRCYTTYEELRRRILDACERDLQSHLGAEQYRRRFVTRTSQNQIAFTSIYESPFRSQYEDYSPSSPRPYSID